MKLSDLARLDLCLSNHLGELGAAVARAPLAFFLVPLLISGLLASGFQRFQFLSDFVSLYIPMSCRAYDDRAVIQSLFPDNDTSFVIGASSGLNSYVDLNLVPKSGESVLKEDLWREAKLLVQAVEQVKVKVHGLEMGWTDICAKFEGKCISNSFLDLLDTEGGLTDLRYPVQVREGGVLVPLAAHLGGVTVVQGKVVEAKALKISFVLRGDAESARARMLWCAGAEAVVTSLELEHSQVFTYWTGILERELVNNIQEASMEVLPITIFIMAAYTILQCMTTDWVTSKPLLGVAGLITVVMSMVSGFGLPMYLGLSWQPINMVAIFLTLGIGLDSVFLLLSSWTRSAAHSMDVVVRTSLTYSDASVSLTIASLTNVLGFLVGACLANFRCVQIFCIYAALALAFNYMWMLTAFGSCITWAGMREAANKHCLLMKRVVPDQDSPSFVYSFLLAGGQKTSKESNKTDAKETQMMVFFRDVFSPFISTTFIKVAVLLVFAAYLVVAGFGIYNLEEGLERENMVSPNSLVRPYYVSEDQFFREHPYRLQIVIVEPLDYFNSTVQKQVFQLIQNLEELPWVSNISDFRQSWLHLFLTVAEDNFLLLPTSSKRDFHTSLRSFLEVSSHLPHSRDVLLSEEDEVLASRFFLQTSKISTSAEEKEAITMMREITDGAPFKTVIFNPHFPLFDQFLEVAPSTLKTVLLCIFTMAAVTLIFIPNRTSVLWIIFTIISVEIGVIGFMSHWEVNLDVITMIVLIMAIGFSVDSSAHISYHYLSSPSYIPSSVRLADCLYAIGPPVLQGACTTMLGVIPLMFVPSYIPRTFAKVVFLVIMLSLVHSLFLLPTLLTLFGPNSRPSKWQVHTQQILSPSSHCLSNTFTYKKDPAESSLRRLALQGSARLRQTTCTQDAPLSSLMKLKAPVTERSRDQEPLSGIPEGLGLTNPGFTFTPDEPKLSDFRTFRPNGGRPGEENKMEGTPKFVFVDHKQEEEEGEASSGSDFSSEDYEFDYVSATS